MLPATVSRTPRNMRRTQRMGKGPMNLDQNEAGFFPSGVAIMCTC